MTIKAPFNTGILSNYKSPLKIKITFMYKKCNLESIIKNKTKQKLKPPPPTKEASERFLPGFEEVYLVFFKELHSMQMTTCIYTYVQISSSV